MPKIKPEKVKDYEFLDFNDKKVKLSELFGNKKDLILVHNMGVSCPYCTMWADGFNGVLKHIDDRAAFVLVSKDAPQLQKKFYKNRDWSFRMVSAKGSSFTKDMKMEKSGNPQPGVSVFYKDNKGIFRVGNDKFGPGDKYCLVWHFFGMLKQGVNGWHPKFKY